MLVSDVMCIKTGDQAPPRSVYRAAGGARLGHDSRRDASRRPQTLIVRPRRNRLDTRPTRP